MLLWVFEPKSFRAFPVRHIPYGLVEEGPAIAPVWILFVRIQFRRFLPFAILPSSLHRLSLSDLSVGEERTERSVEVFEREARFTKGLGLGRNDKHYFYAERERESSTPPHHGFPQIEGIEGLVFCFRLGNDFFFETSSRCSHIDIYLRVGLGCPSSGLHSEKKTKPSLPGFFVLFFFSGFFPKL